MSGVNSDQITITVLDGNPVITELLNPTPCSFSTSFSALEGDVIIWSGTGPGNINFLHQIIYQLMLLLISMEHIILPLQVALQ